MHRPSVMLASLVTTALVAAGCNGSSGQSSSGRQAEYVKDGTFAYAIPDDIGPFDPYRSQLLFAYAGIAYDSLINMQPNGVIVSGLAEKWAADERKATFTLRPDITCSDGTPLTASQVAADLTYLSDPKNASPLYGTFIPTAKMTAAGDDAKRTVTVSLKQPFGFILRTVGLVPIVCGGGLKDPGSLKNSSKGTGPFVLTKVVPGQSYTFARRDGYRWGPGGASTSAPGTPKTLVMRVITNETTAANLMLSGQVNLARVISQDHQRLDARGLKKNSLPTSGAWLWFNHRSDRPTADKQVRQALVQALDLSQVIKVSTDGAGRASTGLVALDPKPCTGDSVAGQLPEHDVAAAEALLDKAGWVKGGDGIRRKGGRRLAIDLHFVATTAPANKTAAELIAAQWKAVGVATKLSSDTRATLSKVMFQTGGYDVYVSGFGANLPSQMVPYLSGPVPPKGTNTAGIENKGYDDLVAKASAATGATACDYWNQAEQALYRELDVVPVSDRYWYFYLRGAQAAVTGFSQPIPTSIRMLR